MRWFWVRPVVAAAFFAVPLAVADDFRFEVGVALPESIPEAARALLGQEGVSVQSGDTAVVSFWMRSAPFDGEPASGFGIRFDNIPEGAFLGVLEFPQRGSDFREQAVPPGLYTLRFGLHPEDGNHMGVAASRDFALLSPVDKDLDVAKNYDFDGIVELSADVGNPHPTVARLELPEADEGPNLWENDYENWVLDLPVAGTVIGIVVDGHAEE